MSSNVSLVTQVSNLVEVISAALIAEVSPSNDFGSGVGELVGNYGRHFHDRQHDAAHSCEGGVPNFFGAKNFPSFSSQSLEWR